MAARLFRLTLPYYLPVRLEPITVSENPGLERAPGFFVARLQSELRTSDLLRRALERRVRRKDVVDVVHTSEAHHLHESMTRK